MESDRAIVAGLIFILLIIGANFAMYALARGAARGGGSRWISALRDSLHKPLDSASNKSMDELRKRIEDLERGRRKEE